MSSQSQISATISEATKERLDHFTESHGLKKNFVVEQALLYFMEARRELPGEAFVPARLLVEDKAFDRIADTRVHGLGIGKALLRHVLALAVEHHPDPRRSARPGNLPHPPVVGSGVTRSPAEIR